MAACEKCWRDAHRGPQFSVAEEYERLIEARKDNPCTPAEQCGEMHIVLEWTDSEPMCRCAHSARASAPQPEETGR